MKRKGSKGPMKIIHVVGARPNFVKIAPIIEAIRRHNRSAHRPIEGLLVHTGQHYDEKMSKLFFDDLEIPKPDINLEVGSASHAEQTAEIMKRFEKILLDHRPTHILVVGDVNSTIACALVASKLNAKIIHVEAGLRSFDRSMPEEINRILTDAISDYLFVTEKSGEDNLLKEGIPGEKIFFVGNVMIDTLLKHKEKAERSKILDQLGLRHLTADGPVIKDYGVLTLHRPSNVDERETFQNILEALLDVSERLPVFFPVHPRTRAKIAEFDFGRHFAPTSGIDPSRGMRLIDPLGYLDFLSLMSRAKIVLTDSGGMQEETTALGIPCVTLRENTERPVTVTHGTNVIAGVEKKRIVQCALSALNLSGPGSYGPAPSLPPLWDGKAAERLVEILSRAGE